VLETPIGVQPIVISNTYRGVPYRTCFVPPMFSILEKLNIVSDDAKKRILIARMQCLAGAVDCGVYVVARVSFQYTSCL
jgi:hypothetical protein